MEKYLDCYWDKQLIDLIQFGFPLDFDRKVVLNSMNMELYWDLLNNYLSLPCIPLSH